MRCIRLLLYRNIHNCWISFYPHPDCNLFFNLWIVTVILLILSLSFSPVFLSRMWSSLVLSSPKKEFVWFILLSVCIHCYNISTCFKFMCPCWSLICVASDLYRGIRFWPRRLVPIVAFVIKHQMAVANVEHSISDWGFSHLIVAFLPLPQTLAPTQSVDKTK